MRRLQLHQGRIRLDARDQRAGLVAAEGRQTVEFDNDRRAADLVEMVGDFVGDAGVDIADEAQGDVIILRIDPMGAGHAATRESEIGNGRGGDLDSREQSRHGLSLRASGGAAPANRFGSKLAESDTLSMTAT